MKPCYLALLIIFFIGCAKHAIHNNEIKRIDFASEGITISIDSSLSYKCFECGRDGKIGFYKGKVATELWDSLNVKLDSINFDTLKSVDCRNEFDPGIEIFIQKTKTTKHFASNLTCLSGRIKSVFYWIADTHKRLKLIQNKDTIKFDVKSMCPPVESKHQVKFPPVKNQ